MMRKRLEWQGGIQQEDRMIKDKYRTFLKTLKYSYQGCDVQLIQKYSNCLSAELNNIDEDISQGQQFRALINPDKLKQDYDDKILSIDYSSNYQPGDVFKWVGTDTYWIIVLQELTEDAYFRGDIRRCKYKIKFIDENGDWQSTWAAIRGPVETAIDSIQKNQIRIDRPNWSLHILLPQNEKTIKFFDRYSKFLFAGKCWHVNAVDSISMKNILEINAEEYYIDRDADDIENEMKDGLIIEQIDPSPNSKIIGETFIKPNISEIYSVENSGGSWSIDSKDVPVCIKQLDDKTISLTWKKMISGQFTLLYKNGAETLEKVIVVESLF